MYDATTAPNIAAIRRALAAVGEDFPKPVLTALAEHDKIRAAARAWTDVTPAQVNDAVAAALLEDRDPADDERVRHLVTAHAIGSGGGAGLSLTPQAEARVRAAATANVDAILAKLAPAADEAGAQLTAAYEVLGDEEDPKVLMGRGVPAAEAWTSAQRARDLLRAVDDGWVSLANLTGFARPSSQPMLRLTDADIDVYAKVGHHGADAWAIVKAGGAIALADRATFAERCQRHAELIQYRNNEPARRQAAAVRREFSFNPERTA